jgi:isopenicillin-N N-acyltransferase like protein
LNFKRSLRQSRSYNRRMFPILDLTGNAFERGYAHGVQARTRVAGSVRCYATLFASCGIDWKEAQHRASAFRDIIIGCGDLIDEIEGIAAGSGFHANEILALNCRTEILPPMFLGMEVVGDDAARKRNAALGLFDIGECTSFSVSGTRCADHATRVAQNWDWIGYQRQNVVILRVKNRGGSVGNWPDYLTLTEAGILAKIGVNSHGLAIGLNILRANNDRTTIGMPAHIFQRLALDYDCIESLAEFAKCLKFSGSSNAILGDISGRVASLEYSPNGVAIIAADQGVVAHTNHFCDPTLAKHQAPLAQMLTTEPRLDRAQQHITGWPDRVTTRNFTTLLRDESGHEGSGKLGAICRSPDLSLPIEHQIESVCGVIINCNTREMLVAPGLPSKVEFESVAL